MMEAPFSSPASQSDKRGWRSLRGVAFSPPLAGPAKKCKQVSVFSDVSADALLLYYVSVRVVREMLLTDNNTFSPGQRPLSL